MDRYLDVVPKYTPNMGNSLSDSNATLGRPSVWWTFKFYGRTSILLPFANKLGRTPSIVLDAEGAWSRNSSVVFSSAFFSSLALYNLHAKNQWI